MTPPALFVSHGAPTLVSEDSPAHRFLAGLGPTLGQPRGVVVLSAHWLTRGVTVGTAVAPETIHDFSGFPAALYRMRYPVPGDPGLAGRVVAALAAAGLAPAVEPRRGLDHGVWVPLTLMAPAAEIPVVPVSIQPEADAAHHWRIGEALRPLRDQGVLILASGGISHNLRAYFGQRPGDPVAPWVRDFTDWIEAAVTAGDTAALLDFARQAPHAAANHPTTEHLLPLFAALGAGTPGVAGRRLFAGIEHGVLALDAYRFD
jgi:4,5-DOPA dioxygenase extradiol